MILKAKKGFTMIELVVVIAVLAILVTLAAITYRGVTQSAQDVSVQVDMKVLSDAYVMGEAKDGIGKFVGDPTTGTGLFTDINGNMVYHATTADAADTKKFYEINPSLNAYYKKLNKALTEFVVDDNGVIYYNGQLIENPPVASPTGYPTVSTGNIITLPGTGKITIAGNRVVNGGSSAVVERGICWSNAGVPTATQNGATTGDVGQMSIDPATDTTAFEAAITGLTAGNVFHIRAYAINGTVGAYNVSYGTELVVKVP